MLLHAIEKIMNKHNKYRKNNSNQKPIAWLKKLVKLFVCSSNNLWLRNKKLDIQRMASLIF